MSFFDHLAELRKRLLRVVVIVFAGSMVAYTWALQIYAFLMKPVEASLPKGAGPVVFGPFELFSVRYQVGLYATLVVFSPYIIWEVLAFFLPALREKERKWFLPTLGAMIFFFALGVAFCYTVVLSAGFQWLHSQGGGIISQQMRATEYLSGVMLFLFGFGIGFETPVVVFFLVYLNIVPYAKLRASWRVVYVVLMVVASAATPDWSPWTMGGLFVALVGLYELSMLLARVTLRKRIAEQKAAELALWGDEA
jgi:sec-independent protein translocase protein TatC